MSKPSIICTIGPSSNTVPTLQELAEAGMTIARLNFSHGDHRDHLNLIKNIRLASKKSGKQILIMQDLQGPKIRTGILKTNITLKKNQKLKIYPSSKTDNSLPQNSLSINYPNLLKDLSSGERILIDDGLIELTITSIKKDHIVATNKSPGIISSKRGVNFPDSNLTIDPITQKDRQDLEFGLKNNVDIVAISFITNHSDIEKLRVLIDNPKVKICAKIERKAALPHLEKITQKADIIMVARGDLGTDIPLAEVPFVQKSIISTANKLKKPVILATQILQSMIENPIPTRAEIADATQGILDGANYLMLSNESAIGKHPVKSAKILASVIKTTQQHLL
ncbi:pyruvate kinase [Candidatus Peregrinibacteria bacterium HGW-Peregrinibacteria-1]|jgi:pyruvate kinase|nr:MAG: pyruvate kinase [Candidatus Peregrinibacteria bacterium HGW-Peregrinibacteria-1]